MRVFQMETSIPTAVRLTIIGSEQVAKHVEFDSMQTEHRPLLWEFEANAEYNARLTLTDQYGLNLSP